MKNSFSELKYETRLKNLWLTTLETKRLRGDLMKVFKIFKGYDDDICEDIFLLEQNPTEALNWSYIKGVRLDIVKYSFSNKVVNETHILIRIILYAGFLQIWITFNKNI